MFKKILLLCILIHATYQYQYQTKYIDVPVDHFSFTSNATFKLRYLINDSQWHEEGPIFFYTGNEGDITIFAENTGFMWEIAPEFNALIVFVEHRYYGTSLPFGNLSYSDPRYLGYLSSEQALADFVYVIDYLQRSKNYYGDDELSPVIAFGGSYGGMLSAWLRMKYPASVVGALASSAPILQFDGITPCGVFNRIVTAVYKTSTDHDCTKVIKRSWSTIRSIGSTDKGKSWISTNWKLCNPLTSKTDIDNLIGWINDILVNTAMVNYPYEANFLAPLPGYPVHAICSLMNDTSVKDFDLMTSLINALSVYTNFTGKTKCNDISSSASSSLGDNGWSFQACTEMIMPMCSTGNDMFEDEPWDFKQYSEDCYQQWKVKVAREDLAVLEYGGTRLKAASNIIFSNGLLDPWSGGGVTYNVSNTLTAVVIPEAAHHLDLRASNPQDPESVVIARNYEKGIIRTWINEYYTSRNSIYAGPIL